MFSLNRFSLQDLSTKQNHKYVMLIAIILSLIILALHFVAIASFSSNVNTLQNTAWAVGKVPVLDNIYVGLRGYYLAGASDLLWVSWSSCSSQTCSNCNLYGLQAMIILCCSLFLCTIILMGSFIRSGFIFQLLAKHKIFVDPTNLKITMLLFSFSSWFLLIFAFGNWNAYCYTYLPLYNHSDLQYSYGFNSIVICWFFIAFVFYCHLILPHGTCV